MIFVGNLTWTTTDEDLVTFLSQQGNVLKAEVQRYEDTKRSKGWGYVLRCLILLSVVIHMVLC